MKHRLLFFAVVFAVMQSCSSASNASKTPVPVLTVVSFNSICCGVRGDAFLKKFYDGFMKSNGVQLQASKVTGCGKEGEYKVMFRTSDLSAKMYKRFADELKKLIDNETATNTGNQQGTVYTETMASIDVSYCRGKEVDF